MRRCLARCLVVGTVLAGSGCNNRDADQLGRLARTVGAKFDNLTGGAQERLANGLQAARASWSDRSPEVRVAERLRWDKQLGSTNILIEAPSPGVVRLHGPVLNLDLRRRAVELAQMTVGIEKVVDDLTPDE